MPNTTVPFRICEHIHDVFPCSLHSQVTSSRPWVESTSDSKPLTYELIKPQSWEWNGMVASAGRGRWRNVEARRGLMRAVAMNCMATWPVTPEADCKCSWVITSARTLTTVSALLFKCHIHGNQEPPLKGVVSLLLPTHLPLELLTSTMSPNNLTYTYFHLHSIRHCMRFCIFITFHLTSVIHRRPPSSLSST